MAKVFLSFFNDMYDARFPEKMPCFYEAFIKGLQKSGNDVLYYMMTKFVSDDFGRAPHLVLNLTQYKLSYLHLSKSYLFLVIYCLIIVFTIFQMIFLARLLFTV